MKIYLTPKQQIKRFQRMLDICVANNWLHLAELVQQQLDKVWNSYYQP